MSELAKNYEPAAVEPKWYAHWVESGCFAADPLSKKPAYSIVIPPPNVTGFLTLGHVLNVTIQDILARRARMLGRETLWLPGTDHAGIATQNAVERSLRKAGEMRHRDDLGRDALIGKIWTWKEKYGGIIIDQLKKLGASCDWSRLRFTMDSDYSQGVARIFVDLYRKGRIYRGKRMVNWCPASLTALSDEEVEMKPQTGALYYFKVQIHEQPETFLTVATTRPETIPGDTALAVNPRDPRYSRYIGLHAVRPLPHAQPVEERLIPIIGDEQVEFEFGTGVLKVTPAHDKADFEIGQRHGLPVIDIMNPDGTMNALAGASLAGLERFAARAAAVEELRMLGLLEKEEPHEHNVGFSERGQVPIEPRLSEQWFLQYPSLEEARGAVAGGALRFYPERWAKVYDHWLGGIQDWCISRQLWWGHRVPVWTKKLPLAAALAEAPLAALVKTWQIDPAQPLSSQFSKESTAPEAASTVIRISAHAESDELLITAATYDPAEGEALERLGFVQDPDVLDTWFSSWLWPFATMGWPEKNPTLERFYPTTDLVTGPDIIFFWVARMIMAGFEWTGQAPFRNVYFTGIIRDKQGRKLSKSLGNSPDPLDLIAKFGADALRFGVMRSAPLGADILFDEKNAELGRNFCTKLWNAGRFRQMHGGETEGEIDPALLTSDDKWMLLRLDVAIREVSDALDEYRFSEATQTLYRCFWSEYCDWYVEAAKAALYGEDAALKANQLAVMDFVLGHLLRLFHPFLPFISEELWHALGYHHDLPSDQGGETLMYAHWPQPLDDAFKAHYVLGPADLELAASKIAVVEQGRALRRDFNIASNKRVRFVLRPTASLNPHENAVLKLLLNAETLDTADAAWTAPRGTPTALTPLGTLYLPLEGLVDASAEHERLQKEIGRVEDELAKVRAKLANPSFAGKVPPAVLVEHQRREQDWMEKLAQLQRLQSSLG